MTDLVAPPATAWDSRRWNFGRYAGPIAAPDLRVRLGQRFRLKEWCYAAVSSERLFVAVGLVQLGYVANAFAYVVDRQRPSRALEYEAMSLLGRGLDFSPSSTEGATEWRHRGAEICVRFERGWNVRLNVPLDNGHTLRGGFRMEPAESSLALLHDLGGGRPAYTHKSAGLRATGSLQLGDEAIDLGEANGLMDWTRSLAARETRWKWASFAGTSGERRVGLNLSAEVYDDAAGNSRENAIFVDGEVQALGGVAFEIGREPGVDDWRIRSRKGDEVSLDFRPLGARAQHLDLHVVRSHFVQPYGLFRGRVGDIEIDDVFGIVEDHQSVW